jgi:ketosteroid isomerase-like protein
VHDNFDIADRLLTAIEAGDVEGVRSLYADDVVIWHNFDGIEQPREANLAVLSWLTNNVDKLHYDDIRRHAIEGGYVQQHVLRGTTKSGAELEVPACLVVQVDGEHITRIDEYLDTAQLRALTQ